MEAKKEKISILKRAFAESPEKTEGNRKFAKKKRLLRSINRCPEKNKPYKFQRLILFQVFVNTELCGNEHMRNH